MLHRQKQTQREQAEKAIARQKERQANAEESIQLILQALRQKENDITLAETAIRIAALSQLIPSDHPDKPHYHAFTMLSEACAHIPILNDWKALSSKEKNQFNEERKALEAAYEAAIYTAADELFKMLTIISIFHECTR